MEDRDKISEMIKHENEFVNQRLGWLGVFQGLLFATLAFAWDKRDAKAIILIVCLLGFLISLSIGVSTYRANEAINELEGQWDKRRPENYKGVDIVAIRNRSRSFWWLMPGYFIPWTFYIFWLILFSIKFYLIFRS